MNRYMKLYTYITITVRRKSATQKNVEEEDGGGTQVWH